VIESIPDQFRNTGIVALREPEQRASTHVFVAVLAGYPHQLVQRGIVLPLRQHEDGVLPKLRLRGISIESDEILCRRQSTLAGPE
jgi:hypothetical protein